MDPSFEMALLHLNWTYEDLEEFDEMLRCAKQFVETSGKPLAYRQLASSYVLQSDFTNASQTYFRALELFPNSTMPVEGIGRIYVLKQDYSRAEAEFKKLLDESRPLSHNRNGLRGLALVYAYSGRYRDLIKALDKLIEIAVTLKDTNNLAFSYAQKAFWLVVARNNREDAKEAIEKSLELRAVAEFWTDFALFQAYLKMDDIEKASSIAKDLSPYIPFLDRFASGYLHQERREYDLAIDDYRLVTRGWWKTRYELAQCYFGAGQNEKAIEELEQLQSSCWDMSSRTTYDIGYRAAVYPRSFYLLGKIHESNGAKKLAVGSYERFLDLWKAADKDLPELKDAKSRLAELKSVALRDPSKVERIAAKKR